MTAEPLFLGIDGGGSKCRARLCDGAGRALGEGEAGAANVALGLDESEYLGGSRSVPRGHLGSRKGMRRLLPGRVP